MAEILATQASLINILFLSSLVNAQPEVRTLIFGSEDQRAIRYTNQAIYQNEDRLITCRSKDGVGFEPTNEQNPLTV